MREIIEIPGGSVPFSQELDTALLDFPSVRAYTAPITAEGKVVNTAGILTLQGRLHAQMLCVCDRCGAEFPRTVDLDLHADITADAQDDDPEVFTLDGDWLDVDEVLSTCFILSMDTKCLCRARLCRTVRPLRREPEPRAVPVPKTPRSKNGCIRAAFG
ncbi:MAG: YceD family protein [Oscillospiraceae bacterium]